jgi:hypothetical protein
MSYKQEQETQRVTFGGVSNPTNFKLVEDSHKPTSAGQFQESHQL